MIDDEAVQATPPSERSVDGFLARAGVPEVGRKHFNLIATLFCYFLQRVAATCDHDDIDALRDEMFCDGESNA